MAAEKGDVFGRPWVEVLDRLGEAVIVLDHQRILRHVNDAARRLLGYESGQEIGGRCKLTTRGIDCENACPLTFALETGLDRVEDFATVYHTVDGRELPLKITVIPLSDENGEFRGAVEILRPTEPHSGFFMAGTSTAATVLREKIIALARQQSDLGVRGDSPACRDVARAIHRFSGMPDNLFRSWTGSWEGINPWPPGTMYAYGDGAESLLRSERPDGWRVIVGGDGELADLALEVVELPSAKDLEKDLGRMIVTWVGDLAPGVRVAPAAVEVLTRLAVDRGLEAVENALAMSLSTAGDCLEEKHLPVDGYRNALVDELLKADKPLAALEERLLREVLKRCGWRMKEAADRVGISRVTLWRKMKDLGIDRP